MLKRVFLVVFFFLFIFFSLYLLVQAEEIKKQTLPINIEGKKIDYLLPYPGILPDHPFYFLKKIRDRTLEFLTRDYLKKAELYLLFYDKQLNMGVFLSKKGKWEKTIKTIENGEKYGLKMIDALKKAKKQGGSPDENFLLKAKLSCEKHQEVIEELLKTIPQTEGLRLKEAIFINKKIRKELEKL